ncbi:Rieske (2Fe-2S) protein [Streptomyces minutiscleroticus]|uniref:Rieske (2Fe-2S) protein n=1 Tax=Streptomyces minutiscleroticus TaxID=68238 RepID=UPI00331AB771
MKPGPARRAALATLAAGAAALSAGCAEYGNGGGGSASGSPAGTGGTPEGGGTDRRPGGGPGEELVRTGDVPVGGGTVLEEPRVVVTQPEPGVFRAFSAVCTHQGCAVGSVADGTIRCPCHGSRFRITDGSVAHGPARRPLPPLRVEVAGNSVLRA